jgi:hypothetical protein
MRKNFTSKKWSLIHFLQVKFFIDRDEFQKNELFLALVSSMSNDIRMIRVFL